MKLLLVAAMVLASSVYGDVQRSAERFFQCVADPDEPGDRLIGLDVDSAADQPLRARYVRRVSLTLDLGLEPIF